MKFLQRSRLKLWIALTITVAILFSLAGLKLGFSSPYSVQDDARQFVFWMERFSDRELFTNDLITEYFSSVTPLGYKTLYWLANLLGIKPFVFNKILPTFLGVITSIYAFLITIEIFPVPLAGFIAALLLNQNLWMLDDLVSGTPRAFVYPLFLAFIYYLLRRNLWLCLLTIVLQGLFYPQVVLITTVLLAIKFFRERSLRRFCSIGLVLAIGILGIYALQTSEFNDVITVEQARLLPEFYSGGRNHFFRDDDPGKFWLRALRSGFFPREWQYTLLCSFGLILPILKLFSKKFPSIAKVNHQAKIIWEILLASLIMFILAHLFLFKLHLPSRYSQHTVRILIALINGITISVVFDTVMQQINRKLNLQSKILKPIFAIALSMVLLYPTYEVQKYARRVSYVRGEAVELYQFLARQPKDSTIASLSEEADLIPTFARRSVLVAREYAIPYHLDYYWQIRQRAKDLIKAQYSPDKQEVKQFIAKYSPNLWLVDKGAFTTEYLAKNTWRMQFQPEANNAIASLDRDRQPFLSTIIDHCSVFNDEKSVILDTKCINLQ